MARSRRVRDTRVAAMGLATILLISMSLAYAADPFLWMDERDFTAVGADLDSSSAELFRGHTPVNNTHFFLPIGQPFSMRLQVRLLNSSIAVEPISIYITQVRRGRVLLPHHPLLQFLRDSSSYLVYLLPHSIGVTVTVPPTSYTSVVRSFRC